MFFYWQRNFFGQWTPKKSATDPTTKSANGCWKGRVALVTELRPDEVFTKLDDLAVRYPLEVERA